MALTPRNIWSPDASDNYALTTDLATLADSVDDNLRLSANYGVGTTAQRTAALALFPNGAKWYDTTLSAEYRKVGGAWVANAPVISWTTFTPATTGITVGNGTLVGKHRLIGKTREVYISLTFGSTTAIGAGPTIAMPTAVNNNGIGNIVVLDNGTGYVPAVPLFPFGNAPVRLYTTAGAPFSATVPITWATGDQIMVTISYFED